MRPPRRRNLLESWVLLFPPPDVAEPLSPPPLIAAQEGEEMPPAPVRRRGYPLIAWLVIIILVTLAVTRVEISKLREQHAAGETGEPTPGQAAPQDEVVNDALTRLEVRYLIGAHATFHQSGRQFLNQVQTMQDHTFDGHLAEAVYAGELAGPAEALRILNDLSSKRGADVTADQRRLLDILRRLYSDYSVLRFQAPSVSAEERMQLQARLGWAGELALVPEGLSAAKATEPAVGAPLGALMKSADTPDKTRREEVLAPAVGTFWTILSCGAGAVGVALLGLIGLVIMGILALTRHVRSRLFFQWGDGGVYAETFAIWMLLFMGLSFGGQFLMRLARGVPQWAIMVLSATCFVASVLALAWPVLRGIPWATVRREIGWTGGRRPWLEVLWGFAWYAMSLPFLGIGLILMVILMQIVAGIQAASGGSGSAPSSRQAAHPIVGEIAEATPLVLVLIFLVASVAAPIVEETFFRGVLYRHLREATARARVFFSVLISGVVASFIFAIIHPQGYLAAPVLMALAFGFSLAREARGSLIAPMVAHGLNNTIVFSFCLLIFRMSG